ncbi:hypothetical protein M8332_05770 [Fructilactobacillus ixorae]|uniref:Uncharacterized protein n=1 Tax=Fructilactobacillus ixorae TaxID=1750535 RepID=A0ABY5C3F0_9LACO|nr:hypothetical protein [Fructilactobacillus ixorae]USS93102.1 hypothetical protein M8332_05770 [Fructilactobacillus ixorae]
MYSNNSNKKIGFLFGAGAEMSYGMPSGSKFALDIFRQPVTESKDKLRTMRENVNASSNYASTWLPKDYGKKSISSYGKSVFNTIIKDTIGNNRKLIIEKINNFDTLAQKAIKDVFTENDNDNNSDSISQTDKFKKIIAEKLKDKEDDKGHKIKIENMHLSQLI